MSASRAVLTGALGATGAFVGGLVGAEIAGERAFVSFKTGDLLDMHMARLKGAAIGGVAGAAVFATVGGALPLNDQSNKTAVAGVQGAIAPMFLADPARAFP